MDDRTVSGNVGGTPERDLERVAATVWPWREATVADGDRESELAARAARRQGAIRGGVGLVAAALIHVLWSPVAAAVVAGIATLLLIPALVSPLGVYARIDRWIAKFAHGVGLAVTWLLMPLLYYLVFLPVGWVLRARRRLRLVRSLDPEAASYWIVRAEDRQAEEKGATGRRDIVHDYRRQF